MHRQLGRCLRLWIVMGGISLTATLWIGSGNWFGVAGAQEPGKTAERRPIILDRAPVRTIANTTPTFSAIAMDVERDEVFTTNDNDPSTPSIAVYPAKFPLTDNVMEPRRRIGGPEAHLGMVCGLALSPEHKEIYAVSGDGGKMQVFPITGNGDISPSRQLDVAHGSGGIFLDAQHDELFITTEHVNRLTVYRRAAQEYEDPLRYIQGPHTELADPHGVYVDNETNEIFVTNHGNWRATKPGEAYNSGEGKLGRERGSQSHPGTPEPLAPSTGKFMPPSVTVYPRTAQGDVRPLRTMQGSKTQMNLPLGVYRDPVSGEIVVANSGDDSVLFFDRNATGDVAPVRVLKGPATDLASPTGVLIDPKRNELWVTNWDVHTASVFPRTARGNLAPLRVIRSVAKGKNVPLSILGRPGAVAFDPKRRQILVPN